jgi:hypothetical protein
MRKITFAVGFASGFLLGSRAGHGPYDLFEARVREVLGRPETKAKVSHAKGALTEGVVEAAKKVEKKLPFTDDEKPTVILNPPSDA